jgi:hypothetical protein
MHISGAYAGKQARQHLSANQGNDWMSKKQMITCCVAAKEFYF